MRDSKNYLALDSPTLAHFNANNLSFADLSAFIQPANEKKKRSFFRRADKTKIEGVINCKINVVGRQGHSTILLEKYFKEIGDAGDTSYTTVEFRFFMSTKMSNSFSILSKYLLGIIRLKYMVKLLLWSCLIQQYVKQMAPMPLLLCLPETVWSLSQK